MKIVMAHITGKFIKAAFLAILAVTMTAGPSCADIVQDVGRLFELHAQLRPGMAIEALNQILGQPDDSHELRGNAPITRHVWLQGVKGISIYEVDGVAHRVAITMPCGSRQNQLRALDALTRQGQARYGSLPRPDVRRDEHYWVIDGIRFAFSRHSHYAVLTSGTRAH